MENEEITVSFEVLGLPPLPNRTKGMHWAQLEKIKKEWMGYAAQAASVAKREAQLRGVYDQAHVHFQISVGDNHRYDPDNLNWAVTKPTLDALTPTRDRKTGISTDGILLADDNIDCIKTSYGYDRSKPKRFRVTITGK